MLQMVIFVETVMVLLLVTMSHHAKGDPRRMSKVVSTKYGALRGFILTLGVRQLQPVEVFLGVPYASAPVGSLRFMPPVSPSQWRGVRLADRFGPVCPQRYPDIKNETEALRYMPLGRLEYLRRLIPFLRNESEDCLYLNIYAPSISAREIARLSVMVFIHGESYEWNSGNPYDGSVLASFGKVIVVTLNYRLGVLGFLPAIEGSARGNYGLLDQIAALHWIQENIAQFGGDPRNITLFGYGHGAACVNLLMLCPMAKGLFQRVIIQSGSALSPWAIAREAMTYTRHLARVLGCPTQENAALVQCMRQRPISEVMRVKLMVPEHHTSFGPTIDGVVIPNEPSVLMHHAGELSGRHDLLFGITRIESYFIFSANEERYGIEAERRDRLLRTLVRNLYTYHLQEIFLTVVNEYTDWTRPVQHPVNILDSTTDALSDALIVAPSIRTGMLHSTGNHKTFFYVFNYQTEMGDYSQRLGCVHGEDLPYVFGAPLVDDLSHFHHNYTKSEVTLSEAVMTYWTNFAKVGDPNISPFDEVGEKGRGRFERLLWPPYEPVHQKYLLLGMKPKVRDHYHAHRLSFWLNLIPKLHRPGTARVAPQHHLLDDHDNPDTYDGIVRQVPLTSPITTTVLTTRSTIGIPIPSISSIIRANLSPPTVLSTDVISHFSGDQVVTPSSKFNSMENITDSMAMFMQHGTYTTALSVTIAVGCSLLLLNVLMFAGVYYHRDKARADSKHQKRHYKLRQPAEGENKVAVTQNSISSIRAPPPSPEAQSMILLPEFIPPPPLPVHLLNNIPTSFIMGTNNFPLQENCLKESQPIQSQGRTRQPAVGSPERT